MISVIFLPCVGAIENTHSVLKQEFVGEQFQIVLGSRLDDAVFGSFSGQKGVKIGGILSEVNEILLYKETSWQWLH